MASCTGTFPHMLQRKLLVLVLHFGCILFSVYLIFMIRSLKGMIAHRCRLMNFWSKSLTFVVYLIDARGHYLPFCTFEVTCTPYITHLPSKDERKPSISPCPCLASRIISLLLLILTV